MTIEEAVKLAVKNGYPRIVDTKPADEVDVNSAGESTWIAAYEKDGTGAHFQLRNMLLDPFFWQALGKAMGWRNGSGGSSMSYRFHGDGQVTQEEKPFMDEWSVKWHRMIDHLADGGTIEEFFETL